MLELYVPMNQWMLLICGLKLVMGGLGVGRRSSEVYRKILSRTEMFLGDEPHPCRRILGKCAEFMDNSFRLI